ncbi:LOW QUALITY PROTEIN: ras-related protein Rab-40B [Lycodopsis pacificus]
MRLRIRLANAARNQRSQQKNLDEQNPSHAPVPKILVGNRLHLAYKRQVTTEHAQVYAEKLGVTFFEVSPLCNFNVTECFTELARVVLMRHGMERLWRPNKGNLSLQDLCCRSIVSCTPVHLVDELPLPLALKCHLKSFSMANGLNARMMHGRSYSVTAHAHHGATKRTGGALLKKTKLIRPPPSAQSCRNSCKIS